ncbi:damage-inducible protein DinB [Sphingobium sp. BHU LFT2]|nr:damage-inducible protein DinB [Sphingobium sp. BHU LFT2]
MDVNHFGQLARYNAWANARLYGVVATLPDEAYRRPIGLFFRSLHGTLNHLLGVDRLWLKRLTGEGDHPNRLDAIAYDNLRDLAQARVAEDERIIAVMDGYNALALSRRHPYRTTSGQPQEQVLGDILLHFFNHQTHHRGQAHAGLSILTDAEPPSLDLLVFQRGAPTPDLAALLTMPKR